MAVEKAEELANALAKKKPVEMVRVKGNEGLVSHSSTPSIGGAPKIHSSTPPSPSPHQTGKGKSHAQAPMTSKLADPGSFSIPCKIGELQIQNALCDLGAFASMIPLAMANELGFKDLKPTNLKLRFADGSTKLPLGLLEDVPIQVGEFLIPTDLVVIDVPQDDFTTLILGRPFLATGGARIDVRKGKLSFNIKGKTVEFCMPYALDEPMFDDVSSIERARESEIPTNSEKSVVETPIVKQAKVWKVKKSKETIEEPLKVAVNKEANHEHTPPFDHEKLTGNPKGKSKRSKKSKKRKTPTKLEWRVKQTPRQEWTEMLEIVEEMKSLLSIFATMLREKAKIEGTQRARGGSQGHRGGDPG